jgi:hypothetical protein
MNVMGWSQINMTSRYQHVPAEVLTPIDVRADRRNSGRSHEVRPVTGGGYVDIEEQST